MSAFQTLCRALGITITMAAAPAIVVAQDQTGSVFDQGVKIIFLDPFDELERDQETDEFYLKNDRFGVAITKGSSFTINSNTSKSRKLISNSRENLNVITNNEELQLMLGNKFPRSLNRNTVDDSVNLPTLSSSQSIEHWRYGEKNLWIASLIAGTQSTGEGTNPVINADVRSYLDPPKTGSIARPSIKMEDADKACGADVEAPSEHCALYAVLYRHSYGEEEKECSGVRITESHVLTAAHCVCAASASEEVKKTAKIYIGGSYHGAAFKVEHINIFSNGVPSSNWCAAAAGHKPAEDIALLTIAKQPIERKKGVLDLLINEAGGRMLALVASEEIKWDDYIAARRGQEDATESATNALSRNLLCKLRSGISCPAATRFVVFGSGEPHRVVVKDGKTSFEPDPTLPSPTKMSGMTALECDGTNAVCDSKTVTVYNSHVGLCFGDSGGGLFKAVSRAGREDGYGYYALVGIVSGAGKAGDCKSTEQARNTPVRKVVRLDQRAIQEWLGSITGDSIMFTSALTDDYPTQSIALLQGGTGIIE